jgi:hypothetical protein
MVFGGIPEWRSAMSRCVDVLQPGGVLVFSLDHPCFENLRTSWIEHGSCVVNEYLQEYEIPGPYASDFHRPLSSTSIRFSHSAATSSRSLNQVSTRTPPLMGPAADGPDGVQAYAHLPNFIVVAARRP